jgi:hypothetical protein
LDQRKDPRLLSRKMILCTWPSPWPGFSCEIYTTSSNL